MTIAALRFLATPDGLVQDDQPTLPLFATRPDELSALLPTLPTLASQQAKLHHFTAATDKILLIPDIQGTLIGAVLGLGTGDNLSSFGAAAAALPANTLWKIQPGNFDMDDATLNFLLGAYKYQAQTSRKTHLAQIRNAAEPVRIIAGNIHMVRELINSPANLLGPHELANTASAIAQHFGAACEQVTDNALQARFPALYAVGAGSSRAPEAVFLHWQHKEADATTPLISLCGKGVCFDTGGYNIKTGNTMRLMRKDMGGAAIALGLASAIMGLNLKLRLELRLGCVENSISGHSMRPSDILTTRAGLTVEVGDTDAEGRLVLCDLLHEASEAKPDWLIDIATLTGAARVALGPDLPALLCNNDRMADLILTAGQQTNDPLWRLPLHAGYRPWLATPFADINNISSKPFAGAITAALFLQHFVPDSLPWAHIDTYAWNDTTRPGKPEGGEAQTLRALLTAFKKLANNA